MKLKLLLTVSALGLGVVASEAAANEPAASEDFISARAERLLAASPAEIWNLVRNFGDLGWHPAVRGTELLSGEHDKVGALRVVTLADGTKITERLQSHDDEKYAMDYAIVDSPLPVRDYLCSITVASAGNGATRVVWQSRFKPAVGNSGESSAALGPVLSETYAAGLDHLEKLVGAGR